MSHMSPPVYSRQGKSSFSGPSLRPRLAGGWKSFANRLLRSLVTGLYRLTTFRSGTSSQMGTSAVPSSCRKWHVVRTEISAPTSQSCSPASSIGWLFLRSPSLFSPQARLLLLALKKKKTSSLPLIISRPFSFRTLLSDELMLNEFIYIEYLPRK